MNTTIENMSYISYNKDMEYKIIFYVDKNGNSDVTDFILNCDSKMKAKILSYIDILKDKGPQTREPVSKYLDDGIFELRCKVSSNITRILYFFVEDKRIVMTNGFIKKTHKTPRNEIALAKKRRKDYLERNE